MFEGGLACLIPDTCFACVALDVRLVEHVVLQKVVNWAHPMWREKHIYIVEESEQCFSLLEVTVKRLEGWHEGISLFPAFCLQNFVGLAVAVVPNACGCGSKKWSNKGQASVGRLHVRKCL